MNKEQILSYKIGVVGAGSWGTALADLLGKKGYRVDLWAYEQEVCEQILSSCENKIYLPGFSLSENIFPSNDLKKVVYNKDIVVVVVPSHFVRNIAKEMSNCISDNTIVVSASKGIENKTHLTMSSVIAESMPELKKENIAVISGPSFAKDVACGLPTLVAVASLDSGIAGFVQKVFATSLFRVYTNSDIIGTELGGAVKNVIAIGAGIIDGMELGLNTRAALITRGLVEMQRLGLKLGADLRSFTGLSGVGDLILTCTGDLSRNHTVGKLVGQGMNIETILSDMRMVAEGVKTAKSVYNLSRKLDVEMPICHEVYRILYENALPHESLYRLMTRELRDEFAY